MALTSVNIFNFGFHIAMSRLLGPSRYGGLAALVGIVGVLSVPLAAFEAAVVHNAIEHPDRSHRDLMRGTIAAGLVGLFAWASISAWVAYFLHIPVTTVLLLGPWFTFAVVNAAQEGILIGRRNYRVAGAGVVVGTGIVRVLSAIFLVEAGAGMAGAIASTAIGAAVCSFILAWPLRQGSSDEELMFSRRDLVRAVGGISGVTLLTSLDAWLARHFLSTVQAGYFSAAATAGRITLFLPSALIFIIFPRFATTGGHGPRAVRQLLQALTVTAILSASAAVILIVAPQFVSGVLFGKTFAGTASIIGIIGLADTSAALLTVLIYFQMARRSKLASASWAGCGLALILALFFHGTPRSLALAMLGSNILTTGFTLIATVITARATLREEPSLAAGSDCHVRQSKIKKLAELAKQTVKRLLRERTDLPPRVYTGLGWGPYAVLVAASAVIVVTWWRSSALVWGSDGAFPIRLDEVSRYFSFGLTAPVEADARKIAYILPWGVIWEAWRLVGLPWSAAVAQRVVDGGLLLASGVGAMRLSRKCWPITHPAAATSAGLFYMFNMYTLTTVWRSQSNLIFHYSLLPIGVLVVLWAFKSGHARKAALAGVAWTLLFSPAYMTTPIFVTDFALLAGLVIASAAQRQFSWSAFGRSVASFCLVLVAMNAYWIYPLLKYFSVTFTQGLASTQGTASQSLFVLNSAPLISALHLGGYFGLRASFLGGLSYPWEGWYSPLVETLGVIPMALSVLAIVGLNTRWNVPALRDMKAFKYLFASLLVVSMFLVTGGHAPFGGMKVKLFVDIHLLDEFRSVYARFMEYVPLAIAPLFAAGIHLMLRPALDLRRRGARWLATSIVGAAVVSAVVVAPLPMWAGWLYEGSGPLPSNRISPPQGYLRAARIVQRDAGQAAVLSLPISSTGEAYLDWQGGKAGYIGVQPLSLMTGATVIDAADPTTWVGKAISRLYSSRANWCSTLSELNVQYVVLETDLNGPLAEAESVGYGSDPQKLKSILQGVSCLHAHELSASVILYRNTGWKPYAVFAASTPTGANPVAVHYRTVGADRLAVEVPRGEHYIIVNRPFDPNLRLNGTTPLPLRPLTAFRIPTPSPTMVVISNTVTSDMRLMLYGACALGVILVFLNMPVLWRRRIRRLASKKPSGPG